MTETGLLLVAWGLWCALHSWLARPVVRAALERRSPLLARRYRLLYNLFAIISLLPLVLWQLQLPPGRPLLVWYGPWKLLQAGTWIAALALFWGGAMVYPLREFCGFPPHPEASSATPPLVTGGVLGVVRHPWYLAALLVIWSRNLDRRELAIALLLTAYLLFGAHLEERRLLRLYGPAYRAYRQRVAAWLPGKPLLHRWLRRRSRR